MRRLLLISALLSAGGCTCLFNPDNVKGCDDLPPVEPLEVIAGDGLSLTWQWPNAPGDGGRVREWELCFGETEDKTDSCRRFPFGYCDSGTCSFTLRGSDAGLQYNKRVFGDVVARDFCGMTTPAAKASATPINGTFVDTQGITVNTPRDCDAGVRISTPGELIFDMPAPGLFCLATAMMGDDGWLDGTLDLEFRLVGSGSGGFGVRAPSGGAETSPRNGIIFSAATTGQASVFVTRRDGTADVAVATAIPNVREAQWNFARVAMKGPTMSVAYGPTRDAMREVIRWKDPTQTLSRGQLGLALASFLFPSRIELRNLRVRTGATIPDGGPTRERWAFGIDSLNTVRRVSNAQLGACPALPGAVPDAGSQCLEVMGNGQGTVEVPIGIDYEKPWRVKFRYAADMNGGATNPQILRTTVGTMSDGFGGFPIIDAAGFNWNQPLRAFKIDTETLGTLMPGQWTAFEVLFTGSGGFAVFRNGMQVRSGSSNFAQHLGALVLGGGGTHAWFADLEISQDP